MGKKKLQLSEIKVNSFITPINKNEQRTTKGGYIYNANMVPPSNDLSFVEDFTWTELKTRSISNHADSILVRRTIS